MKRETCEEVTFTSILSNGQQGATLLVAKRRLNGDFFFL